MSGWVLILGGSTGHGAATAKRLAKDGYGIIAFHFDRGEAKKIAGETIVEIVIILIQMQLRWKPWINTFRGLLKLPGANH